MRDISSSELKQWKSAFEKDGIVYGNDDDYREAVNNLVGYFKLLIEIDQDSKTVNDEGGVPEGTPGS